MNSEILYRYSKAKQNRPGFISIGDTAPITVFEYTDTFKNNDSLSSFCAVSCYGMYTCSKDMLLKRNLVSAFDLIYLQGGLCRLTATKKDDTVIKTLKTGMTAIVDKDTIYEINCLSDCSIVLLSHYGVISEQYYSIICKKDFIATIPQSSSISFEQYSMNLKFYVAYPFAVNHVLAMSTLLQILNDVYMGSLDPSYYNVQGQPKWLQMALAYIENNYMNKVRIIDIAEYCNMSASNFQKLFKEQTGMTPYDCLTKIRLSHARLMMMSGDMLIKQISSSVGFASANHFIEQFKKENGVSPEAYRARYKNTGY